MINKQVGTNEAINLKLRTMNYWALAKILNKQVDVQSGTHQNQLQPSVHC